MVDQAEKQLSALKSDRNWLMQQLFPVMDEAQT